MIDPTTGTFRIRATGRPRASSKLQAQPHRVLPPPLVPRLPLLHRLRDDGPDQLRAERPVVGADQLRRQATAPAPRAAARRSSSPSVDEINGPFHTNDDILDLRHARRSGATAPTRSSSAARRPATTRSAAAAARRPRVQRPAARRRQDADDAADQHDAADRRDDRRPRLHGQDHDPLQRLAGEQHDGHEPVRQQRQPADPRAARPTASSTWRTAPAAAAASRRRSTRPTTSRTPAATSTSAAPTRPSMTLGGGQRHHHPARRRAPVATAT